MRPFEEGQEQRIRDAVRARIKQYSNETSDFGFRMTVSPSSDTEDHVVNIGTSILCTRWEIGYPGGSFVEAIVNNNLSEAFGRADSVNVNCIRFYVSLLYNQGYIA
jgi:hypothetical protein